MSVIKPYISYIDESLNKENTISYILSIQLSLDEFSFCILNAERNKYIGLESYSFQEINNYRILCDKIDNLISQLKWLQKPFKSINIIFINNKSTLVPFALFDDLEKNNYASFNYTIADDEHIVYDKLNNLEAYNVYALPQCVKNKLNELFPFCKIFHFSTTLIESILIKYKNQNIKNKVFANVNTSLFDIVIIKDKQIIYYNSFKYKTKEDLTYFLIFVLEQLNLNPEDIELVLLGEIKKHSPTFDLLYKYIRNISFALRDDSFKYSYVFDQMPSHFYFNLLNMNLCEL